MQALVARLVHAIHGEDQRAAELQELQGQLQMALERRGVEHLDDHVRPLVGLEQVFERRTVDWIGVVQRAQAGELGDPRLVEADVDLALVVGAARGPPRPHASAFHSTENGAFPGGRQADDGNSQPLLATEERAADRHGRGLHSPILGARTARDST